MALSMLAGCSSSSETETPVVSTENNTGVVAYVQDNMDADKVGKYQAAVTLAGNETSDKAEVIKLVKELGSVDKLNTAATTVSQVASAATFGNAGFKTSANATIDTDKTNILFVKKGSDDDEDLGDALLAIMAKRNSSTADALKVTSMSVFDVTVVNSIGSITVDGTTVSKTTDYWAVAINFATSTKNDDSAMVNG